MTNEDEFEKLFKEKPYAEITLRTGSYAKLKAQILKEAMTENEAIKKVIATMNDKSMESLGFREMMKEKTGLVEKQNPLSGLSDEELWTIVRWGSGCAGSNVARKGDATLLLKIRKIVFKKQKQLSKESKVKK